VRTLPEALAIVMAADRPNGGILVDALHLARSGGQPDDLADVPPALLPYLQLADAPTDAPDDLYEEAVHGRLLPGDGQLPLAALLAAVPGVPVSLELRSRALRDAYEPQRRAEVVLAAFAGLP
jgi:sugar phosphate isomerase/epimerase